MMRSVGLTTTTASIAKLDDSPAQPVENTGRIVHPRPARRLLFARRVHPLFGLLVVLASCVRTAGPAAPPSHVDIQTWRGPYRAPCTTLPEVPVTRPVDAPLPVVALSTGANDDEGSFYIDGDRLNDHAAPVLETCDELRNCDYRVFVVKHRCAVEVGTVRAHHLINEHFSPLVAVELIHAADATSERRTTWHLRGARLVAESEGDDAP